jgi:hypothetical protein
MGKIDIPPATYFIYSQYSYEKISAKLALRNIDLKVTEDEMKKIEMWINEMILHGYEIKDKVVEHPTRSLNLIKNREKNKTETLTKLDEEIYELFKKKNMDDSEIGRYFAIVLAHGMKKRFKITKPVFKANGWR